MNTLYTTLRMNSRLFILFAGLMISSTSIFGQTTDENYVKKTTYLIETTDGANVPGNQKIETVTYFDGLGRTMQVIGARAGGSGQNNVQHFEYDFYGNASKQYLPWASTNQLPLSSQLDMVNPGVLKSNTMSFYNTTKYQNTLNPYAETAYELSPLMRVQEVGAPGNDWTVDYQSQADHTIKYKYYPSTGGVYRFGVDFNVSTEDPNLIYNGFYPYNELFMTETRDENWQPGDGNYGKTYEYKNRLGQVVLKRVSVYDENIPEGEENYNFHDTYYVYDVYGNLTYVLSPKASDKIVDETAGTLVSNSDDILSDLAYQYVYDNKNRLVEKQLPGKGREYIVYNNLDLPVFTQDAIQRADNNKWSFTKYDQFGRVIITGVNWNSGATRIGLQQYVNGQPNHETYTPNSSLLINNEVEIHYTNNAPPNGVNYVIQTINYYDVYEDDYQVAVPGDIYGYNPINTNVMGLPTVTKVKVLGTSDWIISNVGYDEKARAIYTVTKNDYLDSFTEVKSDLDFTGKALETQTDFTKNGLHSIKTVDYFSYDHMGRLLTHEQRIEDEPLQLIHSNAYDELGLLIIKEVGGATLLDGYTDMTQVDVVNGNQIEKVAGNAFWNAGLNTRGELEENTNGGVKVTVKTPEKELKIGLYKTFNGLVPFDYLHYGLLTTGDFNLSQGAYELKYVLGNSVYSFSPAQYYDQNDELSIEWINNGTEIQFYKNGSPLLLSPFSSSASKSIGKAFFKDLGGTIEDFQIYGEALDKVLQTVDYSYNVRGWLTAINDLDTPKFVVDDLFNFKINYNTTDGSEATPLYNGNISQTFWKSEHNDTNIRGYNYHYDQLNRITMANSLKGTSIGTITITNTHTISGVSYDRNGNLMSLLRMGTDDNHNIIDAWDILTYSYEGNQLVDVDDASIGSLSDFGFKDDLNAIGNDFEYDANGNMIQDQNKGITNIVYNDFNLPTQVNVSSTEAGTVNYIYDATGVKQAKVFSRTLPSVETVTTQYDGNYIYNDAETTGTMKLQFFNHPEGYVEAVANTGKSVKGFDQGAGGTTWSSFHYIFQYRDHQGSVRLSYTDSNLDGAINNTDEILEETNYYPFGLEHKGYNNVIYLGNDSAQKWRYQGQEFSEDFSLNFYEWKYRFSSPDIGRFWQVDPLAEEFSYNSVYAFQENKLGLGIELEGREVDKAYDSFGSMLSGGTRALSESMNIQRQMNKRGFNGEEASEQAHRESRQEYSLSAGQTAESSKEFAVASSYVVGEALELSGDFIELTGIVTAQPELVVIGEGMSTVGIVIQTAVDVHRGDVDSLMETTMEISAEILLGQITESVLEQASVAGPLDEASQIILESTFKVMSDLTIEVVLPAATNQDSGSNQCDNSDGCQ